MGRKTGLGPPPFIVFCHSSRALSPGGHGCRHCDSESVTAGRHRDWQAPGRGLEGGLGSLFSATLAVGLPQTLSSGGAVTTVSPSVTVLLGNLKLRLLLIFKVRDYLVL
jgi:hypothetical protein